MKIFEKIFEEFLKGICSFLATGYIPVSPQKIKCWEGLPFSTSYTNKVPLVYRCVLLYVTTCKLDLWQELQMSRGKRRDLRMKLDENFRFFYKLAIYFIIYSCTGTTIHLCPYHWLYRKLLSVAGVRRGPAAAWLPGSLVRIPLRAWLFVSCVCCMLCK
jgi:hypothetical protein